MTFSAGFFVGFAVILGTILVLALGSRWLIGMICPPGETKDKLVKAWKIGIPSSLVLAVTIFLVAFLWTGWRPTPARSQPQGTLDAGKAGTLEYRPAENTSKQRTDRLKEGDRIQEEGQEDLQEFRSKFFGQDKKEEVK
jgi:hypothetical protein